MQNIFNTNDYNKIVTRVQNLSLNSQRQWGKMNVAEMLEHCILQLKLALFEIEGRKNEGSFILRTKFGRFVGLYALPWQKGAITPSQMNIKQQSISVKSFEEERQQLLNYLSQAINKKTFQEHPIFGKLNKKDWGRLIWKHLDHHLRQFSS